MVLGRDQSLLEALAYFVAPLNYNVKVMIAVTCHDGMGFKLFMIMSCVVEFTLASGLLSLSCLIWVHIGSKVNFRCQFSGGMIWTPPPLIVYNLVCRSAVRLILALLIKKHYNVFHVIRMFRPLETPIW